jgi:hypothetical protein
MDRSDALDLEGNSFLIIPGLEMNKESTFGEERCLIELPNKENMSKSIALSYQSNNWLT